MIKELKSRKIILETKIRVSDYYVIFSLLYSNVNCKSFVTTDILTPNFEAVHTTNKKGLKRIVTIKKTVANKQNAAEFVVKHNEEKRLGEFNTRTTYWWQRSRLKV